MNGNSKPYVSNDNKSFGNNNDDGDNNDTQGTYKIIKHVLNENHHWQWSS